MTLASVDALRAEIDRAQRDGRRLFITGGGRLLGHLGGPNALPADVVPLAVAVDADRLEIDADELVFTAGAGVSVAALEAACDAAGVMLPFEPAYDSPATTVGGLIGVGLSGSRRPWGGSLRDAVLGVEVLGLDGQLRRFGGRVLKNVAGFDVSRLIVGAFGTLGVVTAVHGKLLPRPRVEASRCATMTIEAFLERARDWRKTALPISGLGWWAGRAHLRFSGGPRDVEAALAFGHDASPCSDALDSDTGPEAADVPGRDGRGVEHAERGAGPAVAQTAARDTPRGEGSALLQHHGDNPSTSPRTAPSIWRIPPERRAARRRGVSSAACAGLGTERGADRRWWRLVVPPATPHSRLAGLAVDDDHPERHWVIEWGGGLRFVESALDPDSLRARVAAIDGVATIWTGSGATDRRRLHPRGPTREALERRVRAAFDPAGRLWSPVYDRAPDLDVEPSPVAKPDS